MREAAEVFKGLRQGVRGAEAALLKKISGEGATVHMLSDEQRATWREVAPGVQGQIVSELGGNSEATWNAIDNARKACSG